MKHWFSDVRAFRHDILQFMMERGASSTRPLERIYAGPKPIWLVTDPDAVKPVLKSPEAAIDKGRFVHVLRKVLGVSSVSMSGEEQRKRRHLLHGTFAKGASSRFAPEMTAVIRRMICDLLRQPSFDAHDMMSRLSLRLVSLAMFGKDVLSDEDEKIMVRAVSEVEDDLADEIFRLTPLMPWTTRRRERIRQDVRAEMGQVVQRVRKLAPPTSVVRALEALGLSDDEMRDEVVTMILAGFHTTGNATAWLLYYLATEEGLADAIANEARTLSDQTGEVPVNRLPAAAISLAAVKETLRLYPSAHWFARDAMSDVEIKGVKLKKGDSILVAPWLYHRSDRHWDRPAEFDINRDFSGSAYLPFGAGPRVCVGMGLAMLELQLIALEFAASSEIKVLSQVPAAAPKPSITLLPPTITLSIAARGVSKTRIAA